MSSETLTDTRDARLTPRAQASSGAVERQSLQPWQFFVLAGLGCATTAVFLVRGRGLTAVVLATVLIGTVVLVGIAALRTLRPLVTPEDDRTAMIGHRTRVALEREKLLVLRTIKELEFDRAMGKLGEQDWHEMSTRLRARAARLMRQLDAGAGYRAQIEHELAARLGPADTPAGTPDATPLEERVCGACQVANDPDARFCKACGAKL